MSSHSSLQIARAVLVSGAHRTTRRASGGFALGAAAAVALGAPAVAYVLGQRAAEKLAPALANPPSRMLLAVIALASAGVIGAMFAVWRAEPATLGLHVLAAPVRPTSLFAGLVGIPLLVLVAALGLPLAIAGAIGWSTVAPVAEPAQMILAVGALAIGFLTGALLAEACIALARGSARLLPAVAGGATAWIVCGAGSGRPLAGPANQLAGEWAGGVAPAGVMLVAGGAALATAWIAAAANRPDPRSHHAPGTVPVSCRGPIAATASATLATIFADGHVRRALGLSGLLSVSTVIAARATSAPAELALLGAATVVAFGALSAVLVGVQVTETASWMWRCSPVQSRTRLWVGYCSASLAALGLCVASTVLLALATGAPARVVVETLPQFTALIAGGVVAGAFAPRRPGRLLGDVAQLGGAVAVGTLALYAADVASGWLGVPGAAPAIVLAACVAGAVRWSVAREAGGR